MRGRVGGKGERMERVRKRDRIQRVCLSTGRRRRGDAGFGGRIIDEVFALYHPRDCHAVCMRIVVVVVIVVKTADDVGSDAVVRQGGRE